MNRPRISVVVPARNEQRLIARCLAAVRDAADRAEVAVEVVVVANRCTDATASIAAAAGAIVVSDGHRNLSAIRNAGVAASTGEIVVTIDADTVMHRRALAEVDRLVATGWHVGGGSAFVPERTSAGIAATTTLVRMATAVAGIGGVMFWCRRSDFDAIGGFDETKVLAEDLDFARRLRRHGRRTGRSFINVNDAPATISCRKFDDLGDWHMLALAVRPGALWRSWRGRDTSVADAWYYDYDYATAGVVQA